MKETTHRPYALLFLGRETLKKSVSVSDATDCWQQVTAVLDERLRRLRHVRYHFRHNHLTEAPGFYDQLPQVDVVLFWGVPQIWMSYDHDLLRRATKCRWIITICERPIATSANWRIAFSEPDRRTTCVEAPVATELYSHTTKVPGSILIDHWDQGTPSDWTQQIEAWLTDIGIEFGEVTRYVQHLNDPRKLDQDARQLPRLPYLQWLSETNQFETFVMTHRESYGYSILDMFARHTRVACPTPLVPTHFKKRFHFETFDSKEELVGILRRPPDPERLITNRSNLSDWSDVVHAVDERVQALMRTRRSKLLRQL